MENQKSAAHQNYDTFKFDNAAVTKLGHYVYALYIKDDVKPFYIGKGQGNRVFQHVTETLKLKTDEIEDDLKMDTIRENIVSHKILRHGLSKDTAYEVEATLIDMFGLDELANKVRGKGSFRGIMTVEEANSLYNAKEIKVEPERVILININQKYEEAKGDPAKILAATQGDWILGNRRKKAEYVFAVSYGIIRQIIKIDQSTWELVSKEKVLTKKGKERVKRRWAFKGSIVEDGKIRKKYIGKAVKEYWGKGGQNPVRYTFKST